MYILPTVQPTTIRQTDRQTDRQMDMDKKSRTQLGFEPTTICTLGLSSTSWAAGGPSWQIGCGIVGSLVAFYLQVEEGVITTRPLTLQLACPGSTTSTPSTRKHQRDRQTKWDNMKWLDCFVLPGWLQLVSISLSLPMQQHSYWVLGSQEAFRPLLV